MSLFCEDVPMPWKELKPMDQKILFIADCLREEESFKTLCTRYGISRKTGYKLVERYRQEGLEAFPAVGVGPSALAGCVLLALVLTLFPPVCVRVPSMKPGVLQSEGGCSYCLE